MDARQVLVKFEKTCGQWRQALERHGDDVYAKAPPAGGWTLGQVSDHVTMVSQEFLNQAKRIADGEGEDRGGNLFTALFCGLFNGFPPFRFKVPSNLPPQFAKFAQPESIAKADALERSAAIEQRMKDLCEPVGAAPARMRTKHPAAGWVNALQWYQLTEMHMRHHLRQLRRTEKQLATS